MFIKKYTSNFLSIFSNLCEQELKYTLIYSICIIICLLSIPCEGNTQNSWLTFTSEDNKFSVTSPCNLKEGKKKIYTDIGPLYPTTWVCEGEDEDPNFLYIVSYVDYEIGTFHPDSLDFAKFLLEVSVGQHVEDLGAQIIYQSHIWEQDRPCLLFRSNYLDNKATIKGKAILDGDRFYLLQVYALIENNTNKAMERFLESFTLIKG